VGYHGDLAPRQIDDVPVDAILRFEKELDRFIDAKKPEFGKELLEKKEE